MALGNTKLIAIVAVVVVVVAGGGIAFALMNNNDGKSTPPEGEVPVFGNANNDYQIDSDDKDIINKIIDENITDWKTKYPYADANQDGKITKDDADYIQKYIDKEEIKLYYINGCGTTAYVNYPIAKDKSDLKIAIDGVTPMDFIVACGLWDQVVAVNNDSGTAHDSVIYPGVDDKSKFKRFGTYSKITSEEAMASGANVMIGWPGVDYFTNYGDTIDNVQKVIAIVTVGQNGPDMYQGALTLHTLLNVEDKIFDFVSFSQGVLKKINDKLTDDKKISVIAGAAYTASSDYGYQVGAFQYGSSFANAKGIWSLVNNKMSEKASATFKMTDEEWLVHKDDTLVLMTYYSLSASRDANQKFTEDYESYAKKAVQHNYGNTNAYANHKIYVTDWAMLNLTGYAAGAYLLAAMVYPDLFDIDDAKEDVEYFMEHFSYRTSPMYYIGDITAA